MAPASRADERPAAVVDAWARRVADTRLADGVRARLHTPPSGRRSDGVPGAIIALPVRNEARRLRSALTAIDHSARVAGVGWSLVLVANDTVDGSAACAMDFARYAGVPAAVAELSLPPRRRGAPWARRLALELASELYGWPDAFLLTTDADGEVHPDWVAGNLAALHAGAGLVCGAVDVDAAEIAALPASVATCGRLEAELYERLSSRWQAAVGRGGRAFAPRAMGASLALRASDLRRLGGLPTPPAGEDRALAALVARSGASVVSRDDVRVTVSCRLRGRAAGGMAGALRQRCVDADPWCDEALVPRRVLDARASAWRTLRSVGVADAERVFGRRCATAPSLRAARMRLSDIKNELEGWTDDDADG